jgi:hypothetical protein
MAPSPNRSAFLWPVNYDKVNIWSIKAQLHRTYSWAYSPFSVELNHRFFFLRINFPSRFSDAFCVWHSENGKMVKSGTIMEGNLRPPFS